MKHLLSLALTVLLLAGCSSTAPPAESTPPPSPPPPDVPAFVPVEIPAPEPDPRQETIDKLMASMPVEEKVGQLFFPACPERSAAELAVEYHLGGYLLFKGNLKDRTPQQVQEEIAALQEAASLPLLIGVDEEGI